MIYNHRHPVDTISFTRRLGYSDPTLAEPTQFCLSIDCFLLLFPISYFKFMSCIYRHLIHFLVYRMQTSRVFSCHGVRCCIPDRRGDTSDQESYQQSRTHQ